MTAGPATQAQWNKPPIPLVDESGRKVKLRLRRMSFANELTALPADLREVHNLIVIHRAQQNEGIYMTVAAWNKLRVYEQFWTSFGFNSEDEYLAYYDLPDGMTLAGWTVMVNLFDKATFVLLGDEVLSLMMRSVGEYQSETDERKKDYEAIFEKYCATRDSFDKTTFYKIVRHYVGMKYEWPLAQKAGLSHEKWQQQKNVRSVGQRKRREIAVVSGQQTFGPKLKNDFAWKNGQCNPCAAKAEVIDAYQQYVAKLEQIIAENLGKQRLPHRPEKLKNI